MSGMILIHALNLIIVGQFISGFEVTEGIKALFISTSLIFPIPS